MSGTRSGDCGRVSAGTFATVLQGTATNLVCVGLSLSAALDMVDEVGDALQISAALVT